MREVRMYVAGTAVAVVALLSLLLPAPAAFAGDQDFTLVNHTGFDVYNVYIAPTNSGDWSQDLLGDTIMEDEGRRDIQVNGYSACRWDLHYTSEVDDPITYKDINLCRFYKVILVCNDRGCRVDLE